MLRPISAVLLMTLLLPAGAGAASLYTCAMDGRGHLSCCCGADACSGDPSDCGCCDRIGLELHADRSLPLPEAPTPSVCGEPPRDEPASTRDSDLVSAEPSSAPAETDLLHRLCTLLI